MSSEVEKEFEVTPAMIQAGRKVLDLEMDIWGYGATDPSRDSFLDRVFCAMASARLSSHEVSRE